MSAFVLAAVGALFMVAKPLLQRLQTILAVILLAGTVLIAVCCLPHALKSGAAGNFGTMEFSPVYGIFSLVILAPWAFVGFEVSSFDTAHFRFPVKKNKSIAIASILIAAFVYIAMTLVSIAAVPDGYASWPAYIMDLDSLEGIMAVPTFYAAQTIIGRNGVILMTVTALAAILTGIIGAYRATLRVLSTMAEDQILSEVFSKTSFSILFIMIVSILMSLLGRNTLNWFVDLTSFGAIVAYGYTAAAARKMARAEDDRTIEVVGLIGTGIAILFVIVQLVPRLAAMEAMGSEAFLLLSVWCLVGFLFYWRTVTRSSLTEYNGMSISGVVLFVMLLYSALMWLAKSLAAQETIEDVRDMLIHGGLLFLLIVFMGLLVMLYIQELVHRKHEMTEREKIRAVEGSLAKSQFLFNMSHDIRTPMNAILGYTKLALEEPASPELRGYLAKIEISGEHLLSLINDILEMSRIESGKVETEYVPADLIGIFREIQDLFEEQMKSRDLQFSVHTSQIQHRYVWCDKKNLNRVLLNVLSNAYKFTPEGGTISASVWEITGGEEEYRNYEIRIQDSGIGMSKEFAEKMFNAFERERTSTDSGVEGTGLGLAITKSLVDLMGGTIDVLTSPGSGTEFIICLKMRLAEAGDIPEEKAAVKAEEEEIDFSRCRLLLAEDNAINMEIARMILSQKGFQIETAENGKIALDMVASSEPGYYDAVLMDIQMPVMDGYTAARAIRALENEELASIPILAMTANAFKEDEDASRAAGMQAHIPKPIDVDILMKALRSVLK